MKKERIICISLFTVVGMVLCGQSFKINLYPDGQIPNYQDAGVEEVWDTTDIVRISKVQVPDIQVFLPSKPNLTGEAVVICPGGGYSILAYDKEGEDIAKYFNAKGIAAVVLKYRLPDPKTQTEPHKSPLLDAQRALRLVRYHAEDWGIDKEKIGIMGFSAGGHLASALSTHYDGGDPGSEDPVDKVSCRPDFSILMYPVISFTGDFQHSGSRRNLVGDDEALMQWYSSEQQVTKDTPPAILIHAADDKGVPVENSLEYYRALVGHEVKASVHIYPYGGHGFGLAVGQGHLAGWPERVVEWIRWIVE
ncbi:MAG: alpha/beta hydrolase [Bacteroidales bacterium]